MAGLDAEQLAELALMGLRYRALGAGTIDFSDPSRLDVYWTGTRMVEKAVKEAVRSAKGRSIDAERKVGIAIGHLTGLFNCSVIDNDTYMAQFKILLDSPR
ncbi:hypothetical protein [Pseudomonas sp. CM27]|uniref:hypothetical protein n=1 Tax=Pseudomonas sp. CM27 TaxID=2738452 RepID=UPI0021141E8A|nr:hypothetical protein [Pseudomonas sp. CM27]